MSKGLIQFTSYVAFLFSPFVTTLAGEGDQTTTAENQSKKNLSGLVKTSLQPFTGKVVGSQVRMRTSPDLEGTIIKELNKNDYVVVVGEKGDFYSIEPTSDIKAFIFRSFILDNVVEGDRVNIRLAPDKEAPIIGHLNSGMHVEGKVCEENNKWLEIDAPQETRFYIAKEFVEYAGKPELKKITDKRRETVAQLMESASLISQAEMRKSFNEIDIERLTQNYQTIVNDYSEFDTQIERAKKELSALQENYLHRKIAYLESKSSHFNQEKINGENDSILLDTIPTTEKSGSVLVLSDRMKIWEPIEESLYLTWSSMHHAKTMEDFYSDQKLKSETISGMVELFKDPIKHKPGDFLVKDKDNVSIACVYSTHVNLEKFIGKRINLIVSPRPNNHFAFPAYYVLDID